MLTFQFSITGPQKVNGLKDPHSLAQSVRVKRPDVAFMSLQLNVHKPASKTFTGPLASSEVITREELASKP